MEQPPCLSVHAEKVSQRKRMPVAHVESEHPSERLLGKTLINGVFSLPYAVVWSHPPLAMTRYNVRPLKSDDFDALMKLEEDMFGSYNDGTLGPYYVRLCCDFFGDSCFFAELDGRPIGYLLSFIRNREAYCTTVAIRPEYQGTRVLVQLLRAFVEVASEQVDVCWFTVEEDNKAARAMHKMLGATESEVRDDFYGPGRSRIVSRINRDAFEKVKARFVRLGLFSEGRKGDTEAA